MAANTIGKLISISQFNKGMASQIFERLKSEHELIVLKNNAPVAVVLSPDEYMRLAEAAEDLRLLQLAEERLTYDWEADTVTHEQVWSGNDIADSGLPIVAEPEIE
ncbi:MAG: type II toxin-antitoxin system Phd/YefM family antitoxin [Clostridiales Family XIII bacterium]|jgi:PHD/YefM family antitoxin component YafN of YafNO toxin-antitoxin module|nr:type II toxin-antitoxin system Phd/YefM family antitoxin [Clostridiales Family XIII bacterium]